MTKTDVHSGVMQIVQELHSRGLAWRDLSLQNVMCETGSTGIPEVTAIDFGACKLMPAGNPHATQSLH